MRVLMLHNSYLNRGGEDVCTEAEVRLLQDYGHEVELIAFVSADLDLSD